jgi:hypothetical protein
MDAVAPLAGQLVQVLTPFLPYLVKAGEGLGGRAAHEIEDKGWDLASKLWSRLGAKVDAKPAAQEAAADLATQPEDEDAQAALRIQLKKLLAEDPSLHQEIEAMLAEAHTSGGTVTVSVTGTRNVGVGRDVRNSTIITGDQKKAD